MRAGFMGSESSRNDPADEAGYRETMIIASMVEDPKAVTEKQIESWVKKFDYWEICDQCCMNLFEKTRFAWEKASEWAGRKKEYEKRAGYVMMARLAVSDKKADDARFEEFFPLIISGASDERNMVKKGVNWALRQIGKRSRALNKKAVETARAISAGNGPAGRWVAADALRELTSQAVLKRLKR